MSRRKGEMSAWQIDQAYPFQVAVAHDETYQARFAEIESVRQALGACCRGHSTTHANIHYQESCFPTLETALVFKERFGGYWFNRKKEIRGKAWWRWHKPDEDIPPKVS